MRACVWDMRGDQVNCVRPVKAEPSARGKRSRLKPDRPQVIPVVTGVIGWRGVPFRVAILFDGAPTLKAIVQQHLANAREIDVTVSAIGDSKSLRGGTLIMTPLNAADGQIYAVAQGPVIAGGVSVEGEAGSVTKGVPTGGVIPDGARIEREIGFELADLNELRLTLRDPDFTTASVAENAEVVAKYADIHPDFLATRVAALDLAIGHYRPLIPEWPALGQAIGESVNAAINGLMTPEEALEQAEADMRDILGQ